MGIGMLFTRCDTVLKGVCMYGRPRADSNWTFLQLCLLVGVDTTGSVGKRGR